MIAIGYRHFDPDSSGGDSHPWPSAEPIRVRGALDCGSLLPLSSPRRCSRDFDTLPVALRKAGFESTGRQQAGLIESGSKLPHSKAARTDRRRSRFRVPARLNRSSPFSSPFALSICTHGEGDGIASRARVGQDPGLNGVAVIHRENRLARGGGCRTGHPGGHIGHSDHQGMAGSHSGQGAGDGFAVLRDAPLANHRDRTRRERSSRWARSFRCGWLSVRAAARRRQPSRRPARTRRPRPSSSSSRRRRRRSTSCSTSTTRRRWATSSSTCRPRSPISSRGWSRPTASTPPATAFPSQRSPAVSDAQGHLRGRHAAVRARARHAPRRHHVVARPAGHDVDLPDDVDHGRFATGLSRLPGPLPPSRSTSPNEGTQNRRPRYRSSTTTRRTSSTVRLRRRCLSPRPASSPATFSPGSPRPTPTCPRTPWWSRRRRASRRTFRTSSSARAPSAAASSRSSRAGTGS